MSMFGVTTPCVERVREILERHGYEVIVFHANGQGGRMLEAMIRDGHIGAVADVTTGELTQELLGGNCTAGKDRLTAAPVDRDSTGYRAGRHGACKFHASVVASEKVRGAKVLHAQS